MVTRRTAWSVVAGWMLLIGVLTSVAPTLDAVEAVDDGNPPASSRSQQAAALAEAELGADPDGAPPALVVVRADDPALSARATSAVTDAIQGLDLPATPGAVSEDGTARLVVVELTGSPGEDAYRETVRDLREAVAATVDTVEGGEVRAAVTGPAGIVVDAVEVFSGSDKVLLLGTLGLVVLLLLAIYRSPVLVAIALVGVGVAMRLAEGVGALLADAGWIEVSGQTASIMTVLLFGVGTDYALIIFARFREAMAELHADGSRPSPGRAVGVAMRAVTGALLASVSTIVAAVLALLAAVTPTLHDFGPYLAVGVASMAAVAFTLTPALLVICGRFAFWPRRTPTAGDLPEPRLWARVADLVIAAPRRVLALGLASLVAMSGGLVGVQQSFDMVGGFRVDTESATGQELLAEAFGPGTIAPSQVLVHAGSPLAPRDVATIADATWAVDGVARGGSVQVSDDGRTAAFDVVLDDHPYGHEAMAVVPELKDAARAAAARVGVDDATVLVGGETSVAADTRAALDRDLVVVGLLMLLTVSLILGVVLRSLLAPAYLAVTLVASYAAAMGATSFLALTLGGDDGIGNRVAVYVLVFLVALGVDYTIFMMTRYRQELATGDPVTALRTSIVRTGGVISSAGVILAGTFAVLMTQPIRELFQFGLAMAIGILLDTFVVRPLLVPAIIRLLGRHALWPGRPSHPTGENADEWQPPDVPGGSASAFSGGARAAVSRS